MTVQIAVKLPERVVERVDRLVADGRYASRSDLVRRGIELAISAERRQDVDRAFEEAYATTPESDDELADARRLAIDAIDEEPWEPWW